MSITFPSVVHLAALSLCGVTTLLNLFPIENKRVFFVLQVNLLEIFYQTSRRGLF